MITTICLECRTSFMVKPHYLRIGRGKYCSRKCAAINMRGTLNPAYKHGNSRRMLGQSKEYRTWAEIKKRVLHGNKLNRQYYKDRNITMCDRWFNSFENFLEDMGKAPSDNHQIDRIDNNGNYEPNNCRWVTRIEQMNNVRTNVRIEFQGRTLTQAQWGRETGISQNVICRRLKRGWSIEKTLTTPTMNRGKRKE